MQCDMIIVEKTTISMMVTDLLTSIPYMMYMYLCLFWRTHSKRDRISGYHILSHHQVTVSSENDVNIKGKKIFKN